MALQLSCLCFAALYGQMATGQDSVEFLNGTTLSGKILQIRKADQEFEFETSIAGQFVSRTYRYSVVHAVTFQGKRFVINEMQSEKGKEQNQSESERVERSMDQVEQIVQTEGASEPEWLANTPLHHPQSLDLSWPLKAEGPWNESKNVGQYLWGRVNPNPARWRSGVKLLYECIRHDRFLSAIARRSSAHFKPSIKSRASAERRQLRPSAEYC